MRTPSRYLVVTDIETSGVNPRQNHEILQIARIVFDTQDLIVVPDSEFMAYVTPSWWRWRDKEAMNVHGLTERFLAENGVPLNQVLQRWSSDINWNDAVVASWGIDFESRFLDAAFETTGRIIPYPYQMVDIRTLVYAYMDLREIVSLREAAEMNGIYIDKEKQHDALYDVQKTVELLQVMLRSDSAKELAEYRMLKRKGVL